MDNRSVEIEVIEKRIKQATKEKKHQTDVIAPDDHLVEMIDFGLKKMNVNDFCEVPQGYPIWHRGISGIFERLFKKIIKKFVSWYLVPICERQTYFNAAAREAVENSYYLSLRFKQESNAFQEKYQVLLEEHQKLMEQMKQQMEEHTEDMLAFEATKKEVLSLRSQMDDILQTEILPTNVGKENFWDKRTRAQAGEDSILLYIFMVLGIDLTKEYYLDLGANHAKELSNTYLLYDKGMRGVLVEANPALIGELKLYRSEDIILNKCITTQKESEAVKFYVLNGDGLSCADLESVNEVLEKNSNLRVEEEVWVEPITVNQILETHFSKGPLVLNVDIEGMEEEILMAIDYNKYAPFIIVVERIDYSTTISTKKREDGIDSFLRDKGYIEYAFTGINSIYMNKSILRRYQK